MSVLASLLDDGELNDDGARLLYEVVRRVALSHNFPPPEGFGHWANDAVAVAAHEFLTSPRATERLVQIAALAVDDTSFERLLGTTFLNYMRDQARQTVVGAIIRRLKDVAATSDAISATAEYVYFPNGPTEVSGQDEEALLRAALRVDVQRRRWRPDAKREGPLADRDDMVTLIIAILTAAEGALTFATLAKVLARRYDLDPLPATMKVDVLDPNGTSEFGSVDVSDSARAVLEQLTPIDRLVFPVLDLSCREAAADLPYGHSTVARAQARLKTLLQQVVPDSSEGAAILRVVSEALAAERRVVDT